MTKNRNKIVDAVAMLFAVFIAIFAACLLVSYVLVFDLIEAMFKLFDRLKAKFNDFVSRHIVGADPNDKPPEYYMESWPKDDLNEWVEDYPAGADRVPDDVWKTLNNKHIKDK